MSLSIAISDNTDFLLIDGAFPHIGKTLALLWGNPEFHSFVQGLEQDTRERVRTGFPADILFALTRLVLVNDAAPPIIRHPGNLYRVGAIFVRGRAVARRGPVGETGREMCRIRQRLVANS